eukprot:1496547-Rhodomonas_salina.1
MAGDIRLHWIVSALAFLYTTLSVVASSRIHETIVLGTVQHLSHGDGHTTVDLAAGYRLWAEQTNLQGGIRVGNKSMEVTLKIYDSEGDEEKQMDLYRRLVEEDHANFLLSGDVGSTHAMQMVGNDQIISISSTYDSDWSSMPDTLVYAIHPKINKNSAEYFLRKTKDDWGLSRVALLWFDVENHNHGEEKHMHGTALHSVEVCRDLQRDAAAGLLDVEIVLAETVLGGDVLAALTQIAGADADVLIACVHTEAQARSIVDAAVGSGLLSGWNDVSESEEARSSRVQPLLVESRLKFLFFTAGANDPAFSHHLGGWVQKT